MRHLDAGGELMLTERAESGRQLESKDQDAMKLEDINLLDRDAFLNGVPHHWFKFLRANAPVWLHPESEAGGGPGFWVISKHADLVKVSRDTATYSSSDRLYGGVVALEDHEAEGRSNETMREAAGGDVTNIIGTDPPEHTRLRKLVLPAFTPKVVNALEPFVRKLCGRVLDDAIAKGSCDFVADISAELPVTLICELLGVPNEDRHKVLNWSNCIAGHDDEELAVMSSTQAMTELFAYAAKLAEERIDQPRNDIMSMLINSTIDGERMSLTEFNGFMVTLFVAGHETTRASSSAGMAALLQSPEQYADLVADPSLVKGAVEEAIRVASAVTYFRRTVTQDTVLNGVELKKGAKVAMYFASANFDEEVFEDPYRFDIRRDPNPHVSFGGGGPHYCLGAGLSRLVMRILFEELVQRVPVVKPLGEPEYIRSIFLSGIKHLPMDVSAGQKTLAPAG